MQNVIEVTKNLYYLGGSDRRLALFESAFPIPRGVSYNSYLLLDEKTVLFDTVDLAVSELFFENLEYALGGRKVSFASDAHAVSRILYGREQVASVLREIGFPHITVPVRGQHLPAEF